MAAPGVDHWVGMAAALAVVIVPLVLAWFLTSRDAARRDGSKPPRTPPHD